MSKRRLRYSLASLAGVIALAAVALSLLAPLFPREQPAPFVHGSFVMTAANQGQCAKCHANMPASRAVAAQPRVKGQFVLDTRDILAQLKPPPVESPHRASPSCPGMIAQTAPTAAKCQRCHVPNM